MVPSIAPQTYPMSLKPEDETLVKETFVKVRDSVKHLMEHSNSFLKSFRYLHISNDALINIRKIKHLALSPEDQLLMRQAKNEFKAHHEWNETMFFSRAFLLIGVSLAGLCLVEVLSSAITTIGLMALAGYACVFGVPPFLLELKHQVTAWLDKKEENLHLTNLHQLFEARCAR